jgi:hypothetical protein
LALQAMPEGFGCDYTSIHFKGQGFQEHRTAGGNSTLVVAPVAVTAAAVATGCLLGLINPAGVSCEKLVKGSSSPHVPHALVAQLHPLQVLAAAAVPHQPSEQLLGLMPLALPPRGDGCSGVGVGIVVGIGVG